VGPSKFSQNTEHVSSTDGVFCPQIVEGINKLPSLTVSNLVYPKQIFFPHQFNVSSTRPESQKGESYA